MYILIIIMIKIFVKSKILNNNADTVQNNIGDNMEFLQLIILSLSSIAVLFVITKLMGYRQISEMSFFDYVVGISIGSIAAEMATNIDIQWWKGVTAMAIYGVVGIILSFLTQKSIKARKFVSGEPIILMENGRIKRESLKRAHIEVNDLLTSARENGYFNIGDIDSAIMETTGKISFQPKPLKRQLTPQDFNFSPQREGLCVSVIIDGRVMTDNLALASMSEKELESQLKNSGKKAEDILLATLDLKKQLTIYPK